MKLYATVTSERACKGQGGKDITLELYDSDKKVVCSMLYGKDRDGLYLTLDGISNDLKLYQFARARQYDGEKGKRQKGERCECGNYPNTDANNCGKCCEGNRCTYGCGTCFCGCHD